MDNTKLKKALQDEKSETRLNLEDTAANKPAESSIKGKAALVKAQTYANMCWLGLLIGILVFIFFGITCSKVNEARVYGLSPTDEEYARKIRSKARNITLFIVALWVLIPAIIVSTMFLF